MSDARNDMEVNYTNTNSLKCKCKTGCKEKQQAHLLVERLQDLLAEFNAEIVPVFEIKENKETDIELFVEFDYCDLSVNLGESLAADTGYRVLTNDEDIQEQLD